MFVGRKEEIKNLNNNIHNSSAVLIYGLRRVGKTSLIKEAMKESKKKYVYYECVKGSEELNVKYFIDLLVEQLNLPNVLFSDFLSLFKYLNNTYKDYVFVIDEYSYLKEYYLSSKKQGSIQEAMRLDSSFKTIIDEYLNNNSLILCGSSISIMKDLIEYNSPLYDRFSYVLHLKEFNYREIKEFFPNSNNKKLIEIYSIFGGSPNALIKIDENKTIESNIENLLKHDSGIRNHINMNIFNEFGKDSDLNNVLGAIKNGAKNYGDISKKSHIETTGLLDKKLKKLLDLDIIEKVYPINMENDNKKCLYEIKDNLLKFYYSYINGKENIISLLNEKRYYQEYIMPSIKEFISRRFERITREYFRIKIKEGEYDNVIGIGSYFSSNSEYDCVLKKKDYKYAIYEAKYYEKPLTLSIQLKEIEDIKNIKGLKIDEIGFISSNGYEEKLDYIKYLEMDDLFA